VSWIIAGIVFSIGMNIVLFKAIVDLINKFESELEKYEKGE